MIYAGFWKRLLAFFVDTIITIPIFIIVVTIFALFFSNVYSEGAALFWGNIMGAVINFLYYSLMESSRKQATLGKIALRIKVTDLDGKKISFGKATARYFGKIISSLILLVGHVMIAFTKKKQGMHDLMAECLVVSGKGKAHSNYSLLNTKT